MKLERASDKPNGTLVNNTTVYGYDLRIVEDAVSADTSMRTLTKMFDGRNSPSYTDSHVQTVVSFLKGIDMLTTPDSRMVQPINEAILPYDEPPFEARFLNAIRNQEYPRDHLTKLFEVAVESAVGTEDPRLITKEQLITDANRNLRHDISWNEEKIRMWSRLMDNIGAVTTIDEGIILSPRRGLVVNLLSGFQENHESNDLRDALDWINEQFLPTYEDRKARTVVHPGLASVLENMETDGVVDFRGMADASNEVELPAGSGSSIDSRSIKTFSLYDVPENPMYTLPMEKNSMRSQS